MTRRPSFRSEEEERVQRETARRREAWVGMISGVPWHHYVTLTFKDPVRHTTAGWVFKGFIGRLELTGARVWSVYVAEVGWGGFRVHLHALLGGTDLLRTTEIDEAWEAGLSEVEVFDPELPAVWYLTKGVPYGDGAELEISEGIYDEVSLWKEMRRIPPLRPPGRGNSER